VNQRKDTTTNYEVDRTVRHYEQPMGGIKRLSVAVVVNYQKQVDAKGKVTMTPLPAEQLAQVQQLVKDAMGYDEKRGDSVNVVNSTFSADLNTLPDVPWWRTPDMIARGIALAKYLGIGAVALFLYFSMVKPAMRRAFPTPEPAAALPSPEELTLLDGPSLGGPAKVEEEMDAEVSLLGHESNKAKFDRNLDYARMVARQDPRIVATVVKNWVSDER
jgi:flagellar M-ring protein FliF